MAGDSTPPPIPASLVGVASMAAGVSGASPPAGKMLWLDAETSAEARGGPEYENWEWFSSSTAASTV